jgi:hypothetical protein
VSAAVITRTSHLADLVMMNRTADSRMDTLSVSPHPDRVRISCKFQ